MPTDTDVERVRDAVRAAQEVRADRRADDAQFATLLREFENLGMSVMSGMSRRSRGDGDLFLGGDDPVERIREGLRSAESVRRELSVDDQAFARSLDEFRETGMAVISGIERRHDAPAPRR